MSQKLALPRMCCVKNCGNKALKGRRTCGRHPSRKAAPRTVKTTRLHLDRVLRVWHDDDAPSPSSPIGRPLPVEQLYIDPIAVRSDGSLSGLPTTTRGLRDLLSAWLTRPGCSIAVVESIAPAHLPKTDRDIAICTLAARLVRWDLTQAGRA